MRRYPVSWKGSAYVPLLAPYSIEDDFSPLPSTKREGMDVDMVIAPEEVEVEVGREESGSGYGD